MEEEEQNLSEVAAPKPSPSEDPSGHWQKNSSLEGRRADQRQANPTNSVSTIASNGEDEKLNEKEKEEEEEDEIEDFPHPFDEEPDEDEEGLDELAAPRPSQGNEEEVDTPSGRWQRHVSLEERRSNLPRRKPAKSAQPARSTRYLTQTFLICSLIFYSMLGTLARLGVQWVAFYPGAPVVISDLWANFTGSLVMGFLVEDRRIFREEWGEVKQKQDGADQDEEAARASHMKIKKTIPLFLGLTVGFCGSFTSFSTFMRDTFLGLANDIAAPPSHPSVGATSDAVLIRSAGFSVEAVLAVVILTVSISIGGLQLGAHIASGLERFMPTLPFTFVRRVLDPLTCILAIGCWAGAIILACLPPHPQWRSEVIFAVVFGPIGCITRFYLSVFLNATFASFPLGTFCANILGVTVFSVTYGLQHVTLLTGSTGKAMVGGGVLSCSVLQGLMDGFCGCLTTVSTWVLELTTLRRWHAYRYGVASVGVALVMNVAIMGGLKWSLGFEAPSCRVETS